MIEFCLSSLSALVLLEFSGPCCLHGLLLVEVPGVCHHGLEVVVVVERRRYLLVVLDEFIQRDLAVPGLRLSVLDGVGGFEGVEEL